jgi:hypothetical protein
VAEGEPPPLLGGQAALFPAGGQGDEVAGRGELDVDRQLVLQAGDGAQDGVLLGDELQVDVDRRRPPAEQDGCRPARQIADTLFLGRRVEGSGEAPYPLDVG